MKIQHTSKYIFKLVLLFLCINAIAQEKNQKDDQKKDSIPVKMERFGVRFGVDLFKFSRSLYDKNYKGIEFVGDYKLTKSHYIAAELGNENKITDDTRLNFTTKGSYIKIGFDYNSYENWLNMENMVYVGLRYGVSTFTQELNTYKIYNSTPFFGEQPIQQSGEKYNGLSAQWLEFVAGIKAEVLKNIYVGFSVRLNKLVVNKKPEGFDNLYIPGFNKTYDGDFGVGFNYTVSYFIPFYKTKVTTTKKKEKK